MHMKGYFRCKVSASSAERQQGGGWGLFFLSKSLKKTKCYNGVVTGEQRLGYLPGRIGVSRAGKQDTLQNPP